MGHVAGLPGPHIAYVRNIEPGLPLFLFNYSDRKLHGIYEAASHGQMNIDPYGWSNNGKERTPYPAQVRIYIKTHCQSLSEAQFKPIISDNYYRPHHFYFELDHTQLQGLLSLFAPMRLTGNTSLTYGAPKRNDLLKTLPTTKMKAEPLADAMVPGQQEEPASERKRGPKLAFRIRENKYAPLLSDEIANNQGTQSRASSISSEDGGIKDHVSDWEDLANDDVAAAPSSCSQGVNGEGKPLDRELVINGDQVTMTPEERVLVKLKKLALERNSLSQLSKDSADDDSAPYVSAMPSEDSKQIPDVPPISSEDNMSTCDPCPNSAVLIRMLKELQERTKALEKKQVSLFVL
ncbi:hypothetical protein Taro_024140 [Colocasia esculenta]|uniref:DCD domain-containing protein n=1 Tax=Colocasia esculenta TaxID=4460 RepID=A0A843VDK7_COLES|nr:hypothetical protein [Colocasia esculenta]